MRCLMSLLIITSTLFITQIAVGAVPCNQCFPLEKLSPDLREKVETALLISLDAEGLYTFAGSLKPHSRIDEFSHPFGRDWHPSAKEIEEINSALQCGNISIRVDASGYGMLFRSDLIKLKASQYADLLSDVAISSALNGTDIMLQLNELLMSTDSSSHADEDQFQRNIHKLFGIFLGYPEFAAQFYTTDYWHSDVEADGIRMPTYNGWDNFVYVVPKGHIETAEDNFIRLNADTIFKEYSKLRYQFVKDEKHGALELLRSWYGDGKGYCAPENVESSSASP